MPDYSAIKPHVTPSQLAAIEALEQHGTTRAAAAALGISQTGLRHRLTTARKRAALAGVAPDQRLNHEQPAGFAVSKVSSYYNYKGELTGQWVQAKPEAADRLAALAAAVACLTEPLQNLAAPVAAPADCSADLLTVYPLGDPHIGLLAWGVESGADFDLAIAERNLVTAVDQLVSLAPASSEALIINLGDFFHSDNSSNRTARSGNALDVDGRWAKVLQVGIRIMQRCIDKALAKHSRVTVLNLIGNHDDHTSVMLSHCLAAYYAREPRVSIPLAPTAFRFHRFGANLIAATHGNGIKAAQIPLFIAAEQPKMWGATTQRFCYCGHVHHESAKEYPGIIIESYRTLAARDAWHTASGYSSGRDLQCHVFHRSRGRILRHTIGIEEVEMLAAQGAAS